MHLNLPRVSFLLLKIVFVQMPIARGSLVGLTFLMHEHNLLAKTFSAESLISVLFFGISMS